MIQIDTIIINEFRGIRDLELNLASKNFVVSGPNGSGKSGIVDAIQFALTGEIGRLTGSGTGDLKLSEHGPHVEKRDYPDAATVQLKVHIPSLNKTASITRKIKAPKKPVIEPNTPEITAVFADAATHPEVMLSRREIIKFILTEATQRSRDVQTLLKLDDIDQTRASLKTTENRLTTALSSASAAAASAADSLKRHLDLPELKNEEVIGLVNQRRKLLGLDLISEVTPDTDVSAGLTQKKASQTVAQTKETCLRDIKALVDSLATEDTPDETVALLLEHVGTLESNPELLLLLQRRPFLLSGLEFVDSSFCPLCDTEFEIEQLRSHIQKKIDASNTAQKISDAMLNNSGAMRADVQRILGLIKSVQTIKEIEASAVEQLTSWHGQLSAFHESLASVTGIVSKKDMLEAGWRAAPGKLVESLNALTEKVKERPDTTDTAKAEQYLFVAQDRLLAYQQAKRTERDKKKPAERGKAAYKTYCDVSEAVLEELYQEVETRFSSHYATINSDDEDTFTAKFEPTEGKLGLLVDFHQKGMFPPGAYHSEGHQDGMGLCLYLALMNRVLAEQFTLAVLDDVVMSVDSRHRKQVCKLLKQSFPNTQFVITTHDQVWAKQMRSIGMITSKNSVAFHSWSVETGPILEEVTEVWQKIDEALGKNEVPTAAALLRRHLEYVAGDLADELGAKVQYRADGGYDMGNLLSAVIQRQGELLKKAEKAAKSWENEEDMEKVKQFLARRADIMAASNSEQWIINKAVHYNEWADLSLEDFKPVVNAYRDLIDQFRCSSCDSWLTPTPRQNATDLRCNCGSVRLNLNSK